MRLLNQFNRIRSGPVASGTLTAILIRVAGLALGVIQAVLTARLLGPSGYGAVAFVFAAATVLSTIAMVGADNFSIRQVAKLKAQKIPGAETAFIRETLLFVLFTSMLLFAFFMLVARVANGSIPHGSQGYFYFTAMLIPLLSLSFLFKGIHGGLGDVKWSLLPFNVLRPLLFVTFLTIIYVAEYPIGPAVYLWGTLVAALIAVLVTAGRLWPWCNPFAHDARWTMIGPSWLRESVPFLLIGLMDLMIMNIGTFMLISLSSAREAGLFQPIIRVLPFLMLANQAIASRFAPRISEFHSTGQNQRLVELTGKVTLTSSVATTLCAIFLLCFGDKILAVFGSDFQAMGLALWWIAGAQVFNALTGPSLQVLSMTGYGNKATLPQITGLATMVIVGVWQIPEGGAIGAAQAISVGLVVLHSLALRATCVHLGIDTSIVNSIRQRTKIRLKRT